MKGKLTMLNTEQIQQTELLFKHFGKTELHRTEINDLVKSNIRLLPESNRVDAYELIFHLDVWRSIWIQEVAKQKPQWDESFTFPNKITFPKESVKRLLLLRKG